MGVGLKGFDKKFEHVSNPRGRSSRATILSKTILSVLTRGDGQNGVPREKATEDSSHSHSRPQPRHFAPVGDFDVAGSRKHRHTNNSWMMFPPKLQIADELMLINIFWY